MNTPSPEPARDERLEAVLVAYLEAAEAGQPPDREEWLARHPEFADELREFFAAQDQVQRLASPFHDETTGPTPLTAPTLTFSNRAPTPPDPAPADRDSANRKPQSAIPRVRYFGDYELQEEIARGGMGVVYRARQTTLDRIVALKMILAGRLAGEEDVARFHAEAAAAASLDHPHIVPVFEVGEHDGQHYFSMGFIEGESLADRLRNGPLPPRDAACLARQIAEAIAYAHSQGVIHRDLKPANILLQDEASSDRHSAIPEGAEAGVVADRLPAAPLANRRALLPKITDFGLAKRIQADRGLTATGQILGTPSYMPPEQAAGRVEQVKETADIYSLGAILYATITGRPPFQADNPLDTIVQVIEQDPVPPRRLNPKIPRDLETICLMCLEKEPARRYPTAQALAEDLDRFLQDEPILARPPSATEKVWRWLRKQGKSVALAAATTAATLVVGVFGLGVWYGYAQWRLGYLSLETDQPPLVAEILDDRGARATPTRTLPTSEPIALPAGEYQVRVTGEARLSQTYRVRVARAAETSLEVNLEDQTQFPTFEADRSYDLVPVDGGTRLVLLDNEGLSCRDAATTRELWRAPLTVGERAGETVTLPASPPPAGFRWPWTRPQSSSNEYDGYDKFDLRPQFVGSVRDELPAVWQANRLPRLPLDLNGDGADDLVLAARHQAWLLALDGKSGRQLWLAARGADVRGEGDPQLTNFEGAVQSAVIGAPQATTDLDGDGVADLLATFVERKSPGAYPGTAEVGAARWVEAVSGKTGDTIWRYDLPEEGFRLPSGSEPWYAFRLFTYGTGYSSGGGSYTQGREAVRSTSNRQHFTRHGEFIYAPDAARLVPADIVEKAGNGVGSLAVVLAGSQLVVLDLTTGQPAAPPRETGLHPLRPLVLSDLTGDGAAEALVMGQKQQAPAGVPGSSRPLLVAYALRPLQKLWERELTAEVWDSPHPHIPAARWPLVADLDGDGAAEVLLPADDAAAGGKIVSRRETLAGWLEAVDGRNGQRRWAKRLRTLDRQIDHFAVGPDVNGDGQREVFVATLLYGKTELFIDCLSGADGETQWWTNHPLEDKKPGAIEYWLASLAWWNADGDGWPQLLVSLQPDYHDRGLAPALYLFSAGSGGLTAFAKKMSDLHLADADGDGRNELFSYRPWSGRDRGGRLDAHRGAAAERWRLLDNAAWTPVGDLNGDGVADLAHFESEDGGHTTVAISGATGAVLWRQALTDNLRQPQLLSTPQRSDFNGDGTPDLLATAINYAVYASNRWPSLHLLSGRDGTLLWAADIQVQTLAGGLLAAEGCDLDGDGQSELLLVASMDWGWNVQRPSQGSNDGNLWLAALSGRTGTVKWKQPLSGVAADGSLAMTGAGYARQLHYGEIRIAFGDLNGDGVRDLLLPAEIPGQAARFEIRAVSGQDGATLWSQPLQGNRSDAKELIFTAPQIGDLDGDGRNEALVLEFVELSQGGNFGIGQARLTAFDGATGRERWRWEGPRAWNFQRYYGELELLRRPAPRLLRVAGQRQPLVCVNFWSPGYAQPLADEGPLDETTKDVSLVAVFDSTGKPLSRIPVNGTGEFAIWPLDADGDGGDELAIFSARDGLTVVRPGAKNEVLWRRAVVRGWQDEIWGVLPPGGGRSPTLVVKEAGGVSGVDAAAGQLLWRAIAPQPRQGRSSLTVDATPLLAYAALRPGDALFPPSPQRESSSSVVGVEVPIVAYRYGNVMLASRSEAVIGEGRSPAPRGPARTSAPLPDPRLTRPLPWMAFFGAPNLVDFVAGLSQFGWLALYAAVLIYVPAIYLGRFVQRRSWSLRTFLVLPALVGLALAVLGAPSPFGEAGFTAIWLHKFMSGVVALPIVVSLVAVVRWSRRRQGRPLLAWFSATVLLSLAAAGVAIWIDRHTSHDPTPYSSAGWPVIWLLGAYYTGWLLVLAGAVKWLVRKFGQFFRRNRAHHERRGEQP